ncbi:hypothetical protein AQUCO_01200070v1 [Aquilegia coerulea]|uniref:Uncharacterized protein n=1 Tax=Aquilegia coerulea TaxID=218851 RepID=A0A2G5E4F7_AQUCA|nr:hypothetical protein AQUCO_01200070v1 [Aquilegia coerulea]
MEPFLRKFFPKVYSKMKKYENICNNCKFNSFLTIFTSSLYIAGLVASFFASPLTRAFGCRPSILLGRHLSHWCSSGRSCSQYLKAYNWSCPPRHRDWIY